MLVYINLLPEGVPGGFGGKCLWAAVPKGMPGHLNIILQLKVTSGKKNSDYLWLLYYKYYPGVWLEILTEFFLLLLVDLLLLAETYSDKCVCMIGREHINNTNDTGC